MPMKRQVIHAGIRIKHPSGVTTTTALENLRNHRAATQEMIKFMQEQLRMIDDDIARVEAFRKAHPQP